MQTQKAFSALLDTIDQILLLEYQEKWLNSLTFPPCGIYLLKISDILYIQNTKDNPFFKNLFVIFL